MGGSESAVETFRRNVSTRWWALSQTLGVLYTRGEGYCRWRGAGDPLGGFVSQVPSTNCHEYTNYGRAGFFHSGICESFVDGTPLYTDEVKGRCLSVLMSVLSFSWVCYPGWSRQPGSIAVACPERVERQAGETRSC